MRNESMSRKRDYDKEVTLLLKLATARGQWHRDAIPPQDNLKSEGEAELIWVSEKTDSDGAMVCPQENKLQRRSTR